MHHMLMLMLIIYNLAMFHLAYKVKYRLQQEMNNQHQQTQDETT